MSFGFSPSDVVLLVQLAWRTVQNSRKACGEHAELTCEITALHINLQRLERESVKVESPLNRPSDTCREDLAPIVNGCGKALDVLDRILEKYNALSDGERRKGKLWKAVRFGNGELANVKDLRSKLVYYTANLSLFLNMVSMGSMGIVEKQTYEVGGDIKEILRALRVNRKQTYEGGGDLKEILRAVNNITAHLIRDANKEGSVLTDYADDDKAFWRELRRDLVRDGFPSDVIREHKDTIKAYVKELGSKGIFDDDGLKDSGNVSEEIEDTKPTQATPESRDEAMELFEGRSGTARDAVSPRTATTAQIDNVFGTGSGEQRENGTIPQKTQIESAHLTMSNVSDTLPSIARADAEINSVAESDLEELEKVDDRPNRRPSSAPIPLGQAVLEIAEEDTWSKNGWGLGNGARRRQKVEEKEARSIKEEKKRSLIKEGKNEDWLGPSRDRASSLDTTDPSLAGILEELKSMGITKDQIEENADFIRDFIQKRKAIEDQGTKRNLRKIPAKSMRPLPYKFPTSPLVQVPYPGVSWARIAKYE